MVVAGNIVVSTIVVVCPREFVPSEVIVSVPLLILPGFRVKEGRKTEEETPVAGKKVVERTLVKGFPILSVPTEVKVETIGSRSDELGNAGATVVRMVDVKELPRLSVPVEVRIDSTGEIFEAVGDA